jgi:hypothetical protein
MNEMTTAELCETIQRKLPVINYSDDVRITLSNGVVTVEHAAHAADHLPSLVPADRLAEILGLSAQPDYQPGTLDYRYGAGYEQASYGRHANVRFSGLYHPNIECEGKGTCIWCGCTL